MLWDDYFLIKSGNYYYKKQGVLIVVVETKYDKNKNIVAISLVNELLTKNEPPVFLCVGTEKVIGDSVGALVGEILSKRYKINGYIYGNF